MQNIPKKTEFQKLLNNCQSRVNEENVKVIQISNGTIVNSSGGGGAQNKDVRPEIQGIIQQKMRECGNITVESERNAQDNGQILFSLKDFLDNSSNQKAEKLEEAKDNSGVEDEGELDENDESIKDKSFNGSDDVETEEEIKDDDSDIEEIEPEGDPLGGRKPAEEELESEITKLENLQKKINDNLHLQESSSNEKSNTVLLRMRSNEPVVKPAGATENTDNTSNLENSSKLDETITIEDKDTDTDEPKISDSVLRETSKDESKTDINNISENVKNDVKDTSTARVTAKPKSATLPEGMFKNISISIVGGATNKNINIPRVFNSNSSTSSATTTSSTTTTPQPSSNISSGASMSSSSASRTAPSGAANVFTAGPNISLKRQGGTAEPFDTKRFKNSSIVITSSRKDAPTITLGELVNKEDDDEVAPTENRAKDYNNCIHGDPLSYMCVDCTYSRWKVGYDFVKTRKEKPKPVVIDDVVEEPVKENAKASSSSEALKEDRAGPGNVSEEQSDKAADILKNVNWSQVFSFAGISLGQQQQGEGAEQTRAT